MVSSYILLNLEIFVAMHRVNINHSNLNTGSRSCPKAQLEGFAVDGSVFPMRKYIEEVVR
jgi:hypothetical protein